MAPINGGVILTGMILQPQLVFGSWFLALKPHVDWDGQVIYLTVGEFVKKHMNREKDLVVQVIKGSYYSFLLLKVYKTF